MSVPPQEFSSRSKLAVYREDATTVVAHALDWDILGCGMTRQDAEEDLEDHIVATISLGMYREGLESTNGCHIFHAPKEYQKEWSGEYIEITEEMVRKANVMKPKWKPVKV